MVPSGLQMDIKLGKSRALLLIRGQWEVVLFFRHGLVGQTRVFSSGSFLLANAGSVGRRLLLDIVFESTGGMWRRAADKSAVLFSEAAALQLFA